MGELAQPSAPNEATVNGGGKGSIIVQLTSQIPSPAEESQTQWAEGTFDQCPGRLLWVPVSFWFLKCFTCVRIDMRWSKNPVIKNHLQTQEKKNYSSCKLSSTQGQSCQYWTFLFSFFFFCLFFSVLYLFCSVFFLSSLVFRGWWTAVAANICFGEAPEGNNQVFDILLFTLFHQRQFALDPKEFPENLRRSTESTDSMSCLKGSFSPTNILKSTTPIFHPSDLDIGSKKLKIHYITFFFLMHMIWNYFIVLV